ncbi:MAG: hypothetical protein HFG27_08225 [Provencibacterium sp.]|jgi:hypothetical protein|nr:hypothetical protein [Provencibacterium sp.]
MTEKDPFPSPEEVSFYLMNRRQRTAIPIDCLPETEWKKLRGEILLNIGRGLSRLYLERKARKK